jgi:UDP-glucose 4-epimerase
MVIPNMVVRALRNDPILVYGDGNQSRCFSAVNDVVRGTLLLADCDAAHGQIFNIGTDEEITVGKLAERIRTKCGTTSTIECVPYEQIYGRSFEDMRRRVPDLTKIQRFVGYRPAIDLDKLLDRVIKETCEEMGRPMPVGLADA